MILNEELLAVQRGEQGEAMRKVLNTLVMYGEAFGAKRMVKITGKMGHAVIGTGSMTWKPVFDLMEELIDGGALPRQSFTTDPRGVEPHVPMSLADRAMFKVIFSGQKRMEKEWERMGIKDSNAYTCTAYMDEVGNIPEYGDILGWAESSAVSYANSVIGARCNRNSGILELMSNILGYVPEFGLLTDEGRKADWIIEVKCQNMPEPQLLGSAIGFKCVEDVPFIRGLDKWLGSDLTQKVRDYLKDMGAAAASNGSVGLYHVENITPEAVLSATPEGGNSLIKENAKVFVIDDEEIARVKASYPNPWEERKDSSGAPELAFAGCPHFSCEQLCDWTDRLTAGLEKHGNTKVTVNTIFCAAPDVRVAFEEKYPQKANKLKEMGVTVSGLCPLSYTSNPLTDKIRIITASNKLRYYSKARFFSEAELVDIITGGWKEEGRK
jgi:predicted aconitase